MNSLKLISIGFLVVLVTPLSSVAQVRNSAFATSTNSETNKVSNATEKINQSINKFTIMDGTMSTQTMSLTMSGQGVEGRINDVVMQNFGQMNTENSAIMDDLKIGLTSENEIEAIVKSDLNVQDAFSMTMTMTTNEQDAIMYEETTELTKTELIDNYTSTTDSETFSSETGFISTF